VLATVHSRAVAATRREGRRRAPGGDAADFLDPFTGQGIYSALRAPSSRRPAILT